jgi:AhpD family alkylhydroperoxidase
MFGFVPQFYESMPEAIRAAGWGVQRDLELSETRLDNKTKELIGLAVAAHIKCRYCIHFHTEAARANGASDAELREAVAMGGLTVLFSNMITGAQTDFERFKAETNRAIQHISAKMGGASAARRAPLPPARV